MSTQPRKRPRWYIAVAIVSWILLFAVLGVMFLLQSMGVLRDTRRDTYVPILVGLLLTITIFAFVWTCWVVPVLSAPDIPLRSTLAPSHRRSSLLMFTLSPGLVLMGLAVPFAYMHLRDRDWNWTGNEEQTRTAVFFAVGLGITLAGAVIGRFAIGRLRRASAQHRICYACGYDLRGSPTGDCPECGFHTQLPATIDR